MRNVFLLSGVLAAIIAGQTTTSAPAISGEATHYLNQALDLMQAYSLHRKEIDWARLRREVFVYAKAAQTTQETYPAIVFACTQLKANGGNCLASNKSQP